MEGDLHRDIASSLFPNRCQLCGCWELERGLRISDYADYLTDLYSSGHCGSMLRGEGEGEGLE